MKALMSTTSVASTSKACLLGSLYLCQTVPKGYLYILPIILSERGESMKVISYMALFSMLDIFKPLYGFIFDSKSFSSVKSRKKVILYIHLSLILLFSLSLLTEIPKTVHLVLLFSISNILTSMHDAAVDGLAVQILLPKEHSIGAFGQYTGYKLGSILSGGILPSFFGNNHRGLRIGIITIISIVFFTTFQYNLSKVDDTTNLKTTPLLISSPDTADGDYESFKKLLRYHLFSWHGFTMILMLLLYKAADHGLDFIWRPLLIQTKISRQVVIQSQFILGSISAIAGAFLGNTICSATGNSGIALILLSFFRLLPCIMQYYFAITPSLQTVPYIAIHAVLENFIGSAITGSMFSYLLEKSDPNYPATSYAFMNSIAMIGMSGGEFILAQLSHYFGFKNAILVGIFLHVCFPVVLYISTRIHCVTTNPHKKSK